ncbi:hypothetical protein MKX03_012059, partial [Papaver bracteatum]
EQFGPDGVAQQGMELFQMTLDMIFDPLQGPYKDVPSIQYMLNHRRCPSLFELEA